MTPQNNILQSRTLRFFFLGWILLFSGMPFSASAKIVFCVDDDLFVMDDDGSRRRRLTRNTTAFDTHPRWSPDRKRIAFTRYMDKTQTQTTAEVFIINADDSHPQRLTHNNVIDVDSSWSPDGEHIAFSSTRSGDWRVYVLEVATRAVRQITDAPSAAPDWSSDGREITFERFIELPNGISPKTIYVMDADGQHSRPAVPDPPLNAPLTFRYFPRWSSDGQSILFYEARWFKEGDTKTFIVQRIGDRKQEITEINDRLGNNFLIAGASWMAEDRAIVFSLKLLDKPIPNYDLYRYDLQTRGLRRLTSTASDEMWPDWTQGGLSVSPHGKVTTLWGEIKQSEH